MPPSTTGDLENTRLRALHMESLGSLASGIAHDLNNVLTPIMMSIELLKCDPANDPRRRKILDNIEDSSRRGAELVRQVLSFTRGVGGQRVAMRLRLLITEFEGLIGQTFPRNIRLVTHVDPALWPITANPSQLHQVVLNLVINARDALPQGGTLTLRATNITIDPQFAGTSQEAKAGTYVLLEVTDTGLGISPMLRERIFDHHFTTKPLGQGYGIGLATVRTVVRNHGGFMNVESELGQGTTFRVYLPSDPTLQNVATTPACPAALPRGAGELVLVVDDEASIREVTQQTLEAFGYRVITANDGAEATALYAQRATEIALVLTDMLMPVMDGATTIVVLRRINPAVRIIAASGSDSGNNLACALNAGASNFLPKPFTAETLLQLVREALNPSAPSPH